MKNVYVPETVVYMGKEYVGGAFQDVPEELANIISQHPQWSKAKPPKPVDKFAHLKGQKLDYLLGQLAEYEKSLTHLKKQFNLNQTMGSIQPKQLVTTLERVTAEYLELKEYLKPVIDKREAEEAARRERIVEQAKARGAVIMWSTDGSSWSEHYPTEITITKEGKVVGDKIV